MKLKKFKKEESNKKNIFKIIGAFVVVGILFLAGISYAIYQRETEVVFMDAVVGDFRVYIFDLRESSTSNSITLDYEVGGLNPTVTCKFGTSAGNYNLAATTTTNSKCTKTGLSQVTPYYYQMCVKNNLNQESCIAGSVYTEHEKPELSDIAAKSVPGWIELKFTMSGYVDRRTCKYGIDKNYEEQGDFYTSGNGCVLHGVKTNTTYYYQVCASNSAGETCKTGSIKTLSFGDTVNIGDTVFMTPTATSYTIPTNLTGYESSQQINPRELDKWRVIRKNADGTVDVVSEYVSHEMIYFNGSTGYMNFIEALNTIAAQYTNTKYVQSTRHMGYVDQKGTCSGTLSYLIGKNCPSDTGYEIDSQLVNEALGTLMTKDSKGYTSSYWLASRYAERSTYSQAYYGGRYIMSPQSELDWKKLALATTANIQSKGPSGANIRPILTLKSTIQTEAGNGRIVTLN